MESYTLRGDTIPALDSNFQSFGNSKSRFGSSTKWNHNTSRTQSDVKRLRRRRRRCRRLRLGLSPFYDDGLSRLNEEERRRRAMRVKAKWPFSYFWEGEGEKKGKKRRSLIVAVAVVVIVVCRETTPFFSPGKSNEMSRETFISLRSFHFLITHGVRLTSGMTVICKFIELGLLSQ